MAKIIGATSAIATACARLWASEGSDFFLVARNADKLEQTAADLKGRTQRAEFFSGIFQVRQQRQKKPITELRLRSASFLSYANACGARVSRAGAQAAKSKKRVGRLFGKGKGRFRTRGRFSSAVIRG